MMKAIDFQTINQSFDLYAYIIHLSPLKQSGRWHIGPCPICGGIDRFNLTQDQQGWRWFCRGCGEGKYHSAVDFAHFLYPNVPLSEAVTRMLNLPVPDRFQKKDAQTSSKPTPDTQSVWQNVIDYGQNMFWSPAGSQARDYLHSRGFTEKTLKSIWHRIGWSEGKKVDGCWVDRGIIIPCFRTKFDASVGEIQYIKIRRLPHHVWKFKPERTEKYRQLPHSKPGIFNFEWISTDVVFITEGEFDTLVLYQEAKELVGACTLGSATNRLNFAQWGLYFLPVLHIITVYDNDPAGHEGTSAWEDLGGRVKKARVPDHFKDINEFFTSGGDIGSWVMAVLAEYNIK